MQLNKLYTIANQFSEKIGIVRSAQQQPTTTTGPAKVSQQELNNAYRELAAIVQRFLDRTPVKFTMGRPMIKPTQGNQKATVSANFIITNQNFEDHLRKLRIEIARLQQKYPSVVLLANYDNRDERRAKL